MNLIVPPPISGRNGTASNHGGEPAEEAIILAKHEARPDDLACGKYRSNRLFSPCPHRCAKNDTRRKQQICIWHWTVAGTNRPRGCSTLGDASDWSFPCVQILPSQPPCSSSWARGSPR